MKMEKRSHPSSSISEVKTGKEKRGKMKMRKEISPQLKNRKREDKIKIVKEISPQLAISEVKTEKEKGG